MHFAGESLNGIAKLDLQHVGYRGAAPAITDLVAGQIPVGIVGMPPVLPFLTNGRLNVLAVTSSNRSATLPGVPTVAEHPGYATYRFTNWMGM